VFKAKDQAEGAGAHVQRIIGNNFIKNLDPFLMLDLFNVQLPA
jgi:redox-sensitive bicupin YhaK (pirin superfamily)